MTNSEPNRLDRIEAILESIGQRVDSNARAIQALADDRASSEKKLDRDRARLYQAMSQMAEGMAQMSDRVASVASAQASFWKVQADYYRRLEAMDERQAQIIEILNRLTNKSGEN